MPLCVIKRHYIQDPVTWGRGVVDTYRTAQPAFTGRLHIGYWAKTGSCMWILPPITDSITVLFRDQCCNVGNITKLPFYGLIKLPVNPMATATATATATSQPKAPFVRIANLEQQQKHDAATQLNYWDDPCDGSAPTPIFIGKGRITNERPHLPHSVVVSDVTGNEDAYTLDGHGFQYHRRASTEKEFLDDDTIKTSYYAECVQLMKDVTGASRVHIFNHKVRRGPTHWHHLGLKNLANRGPVTKTHVDQSYAGAEMRLRWELPLEADELAKRRYQIINIWRPIKTIRKDPIAVADATSVPDADLVGAEMVEDGYKGESWVVRWNPEHRWYFKRNLGTEEVLLIKCFDSEVGVARRALHSAFEDEACRDEESRQSIEVRCLVFYG
jgi:hypothetical protein